MEYAKLGTTELEVSKICFGTLWIGGVDAQEAISAIQKSLELGCNFVDTAEAYGKGQSEEIVARAISGKRDKIIIATKGGLDWGQFGEKTPIPTEQHIGITGERSTTVFRNSHPIYIEAAIEGSLKRLNTDYIDLYQIHYPDSTTPWGDTIEALRKAQSDGKIRYFGVCNFSNQQMSEWLQAGPIYSSQFLYNMLELENRKSLIPFCRDQNIAILPYSVLAHGLLTGKFTEKTQFAAEDARANIEVFRSENFRTNLTKVEQLKDVASSKGITPAQLAIAWVLTQSGITSCLVAAKNPLQAAENLRAVNVKVSEADLADIEKILTRSG